MRKYIKEQIKRLSIETCMRDSWKDDQGNVTYCLLSTKEKEKKQKIIINDSSFKCIISYLGENEMDKNQYMHEERDIKSSFNLQ